MADLSIEELAEIERTHPVIGRAIRKLQTSHNYVAQQVSASPVGQTPPPPPHTDMKVQGGGGFIDVAVTRAADEYRGSSNFLEIADNSSFAGARQVEMGAGPHWREHVGPGTFYVRSNAAHPTSGPSRYLTHPDPVVTSDSALPALQTGGRKAILGGGYGNAPYTGPTPPKRS